MIKIQIKEASKYLYDRITSTNYFSLVTHETEEEIYEYFRDDRGDFLQIICDDEIEGNNDTIAITITLGLEKHEPFSVALQNLAESDCDIYRLYYTYLDIYHLEESLDRIAEELMLYKDGKYKKYGADLLGISYSDIDEYYTTLAKVKETINYLMSYMSKTNFDDNKEPWSYESWNDIFNPILLLKYAIPEEIENNDYGYTEIPVYYDEDDLVGLFIRIFPHKTNNKDKFDFEFDFELINNFNDDFLLYREGVTLSATAFEDVFTQMEKEIINYRLLSKETAYKIFNKPYDEIEQPNMLLNNVKDISNYINDFIHNTNFEGYNCNYFAGIVSVLIPSEDTIAKADDSDNLGDYAIGVYKDTKVDLYIVISVLMGTVESGKLSYNFTLADLVDTHYLSDWSLSEEELTLNNIENIFNDFTKALLNYDKITKECAYKILGKSEEKGTDNEIIDKDFIYKMDDSNKFTIETEYDNVDEFILSAPTGDIKQDTIKICTIDTKIPIIQIQKTEKDKMIFLVDLITADRKEFRLKSYMQTKEDFNKLLQETVDMLNSSAEFSKYASDIEDYIS